MGKAEALANIDDTVGRLSWGQALKEAVANSPKSAGRFVMDILNPIFHPIETAKAVGGLAIGTAQKAIPGQQDAEKHFDAMVDFMKGRYGGIEEFKKTVAKDPVGVLGDIASVAVSGGAAVRGVGTAGKVRSLQTVGKTLGKVGAAMDPAHMAGKAIGGVMKRAPEAMYQSAAKFSTVAGKQDRMSMTATALNNKLMPNYKGIEKMEALKTKIGSEINNVLAAADATGERKAIGNLFKDFAELRKQAVQTSTTPQKDLAAIRKIQKDIIQMAKEKKRLKLTPSELQAYKTGIYDEIENYYKKTARSPINVRARKAVASAARRTLEDMMPEIKGLNQNYGKLKELTKSLEQAAGRITNRDFLGIGTPIKSVMGTAAGAAGGGAIAGTLGGAAGGAIGLAIGILDAPQVKAKLALVLADLRKRGRPVSSASMKLLESGFGLGAFQAGRLRENAPR
jgi:hypothetical protein